MENIMVFDGKMKVRTGIIFFMPIVCFAFCLIYYLSLVFSPISGHSGPLGIVAVTSHNFDNLFIILAISGIITAAALIYCLVIIARLKELNSANKIIWIIFLSIFAPLAIAVFWLVKIRPIEQ